MRCGRFSLSLPQAVRRMLSRPSDALAGIVFEVNVCMCIVWYSEVCIVCALNEACWKHTCIPQNDSTVRQVYTDLSQIHTLVK